MAFLFLLQTSQFEVEISNKFARLVCPYIIQKLYIGHIRIDELFLPT